MTRIKGMIAWLAAMALTTSVTTQSTQPAVEVYNWVDETVNCACKKTSIGTLKSPKLDYSQDDIDQRIDWLLFRAAYDGLVDADYVDKQTRKYNCHSYVFRGKDQGWLEDRDAYIGTTPGCWKKDTTGTIKSSKNHSMFTAGNEGKCGARFLCTNNQKVYGDDTPTTIYKKL